MAQHKGHQGGRKKGESQFTVLAGCDWCGEEKLTRGWVGGLGGHFKKARLCEGCWAKMKEGMKE